MDFNGCFQRFQYSDRVGREKKPNQPLPDRYNLATVALMPLESKVLDQKYRLIVSAASRVAW
ncbi:MAG: hypothetical protein RLZZ511_2247 [Cyanobacteriota bacterium]|jgi:hypothetical protein